MKFIDTNVFIRFFTGDDAGKQRASLELFQRVQAGAETVMTSEAILHEATYLLASPTHYNLTHKEIRDRFHPLLRLRGVKMPHKRLCLEALDIFGEREYLDYVDALQVAHVRHGTCDGIYSYDRDYDRIPGTNRLEPPGP